MIRRPNPAAVPILLALILVNVACSGFFSVYWLKDTRWVIDPTDLGIRWLSDDDYRAIAASTAPE